MFYFLPEILLAIFAQYAKPVISVATRAAMWGT
jgi:hypothetical protein